MAEPLRTIDRKLSTPTAVSSDPVPWIRLLAVALLFTILDAVKPLHMDDPAYCAFAAHIAEHPLDPYGFTIFWWQEPQPANEILAPPIVPYWLALGRLLLGPEPVLWKLWMFPFALVFVGSLFALFRRFTRGLELPLTILTVFSPAFLPSMNLMLDVPALALSLGALVIFLTSVERRSWSLALLAGLVAGLAMQTKYTAVVGMLAILASALLSRQARLGLAAGLVAGAVFLSWEWFTAQRYGESHLLCNLHQKHTVPPTPLALVESLFSILGGVFPTGILLGLIGLNASRRMVRIGAIATALVYVLVALFSERAISAVALFGVLGIGLLGITVAVLRRLRRPPSGKELEGDGAGRAVWFLAAWLCMEVLGYFVLSPFPAVRRVMGLVVVLTLLFGRLLVRSGLPAERRRAVSRVVVLGVLLGLVCFGVDHREAFGQKEAAERTADWIRQEEPQARIWFVGHWGFQFYAERAGMQPVIPAPANRPAHPPTYTPSLLRKGDWVVIPQGLYQQRIVLPPDRCSLVARLPIVDLLPLRTIWCYYAGVTPLQHLEGTELLQGTVAPRWLIAVLRITEDVTPSSPD